MRDASRSRCARTAGLVGLAALLALPARAQEAPKVTAIALSPTTVQITWTTIAGPIQYRVHRGPTSSGPWEIVGPKISGLSYTDTDASPATTYAYRVKLAGHDVVSDPVLVTTPAAPPSPGPTGSGRGSRSLAASVLTDQAFPATPVLAPVNPAITKLGSAASVLPQMTAPLGPDLRCEIQASKTGLASDWNLSHTSVNVLTTAQIWLRLTLRNDGGSQATSVPGAIGVKVNGVIIGILGLPPQNAAAVPAGASVALTPIPLGLDPGQRQVEVTGSADTGNTIGESNEGNNGCQKSFQLLVPDL